MSDPHLCAALRVAYRQYDAVETTDSERDSILRAMCEHLPIAEAELAASALHHREEARRDQMLLANLITRQRTAA